MLCDVEAATRGLFHFDWDVSAAFPSSMLKKKKILSRSFYELGVGVMRFVCFFDGGAFSYDLDRGRAVIMIVPSGCPGHPDHSGPWHGV